MFELRFLGEVSLGVPPGPALRQLTRPRSVAMLAILAASEGDGVTRDRLVALLWESVDRERARHSLANQIHLVRKALGKDSVLTAGEFVHLNPARVSADIREFRTALEDGDLERAAGSYRGPFLRGFHLDGADEFQRWTDTERQVLATSALDVFEELARREAREGRPAGEVRWLQRAVRCDPWNSRAALSLAHALARSGDPGNGVQALREHVRRLAEDLQISADPAILSLIETGDFGVELVADASLSSPAASPGARRVPAREDLDGVSADARGSSPRRVAGRIVAALATFALVVAAGAFVDRVRGLEGGDASRLAVLPALPVGVDSSVADLVTAQFYAELADWEFLDAAPRHETEKVWRRLGKSASGDSPDDGIRRAGRRLRAGNVLTFHVSPSPGGIEIAAALNRLPTGEEVASARTVGTPDSLSHAVHDLLVRLKATELGVPADRIATLAGHDHEAVRLFLRSHPHESEAQDRLLREAIARDSSFALAALELYESFQDYSMPDGDDPAAVAEAAKWAEVAALIWKNRNLLSPADRAYAEARLGWRFNPAHTARLEVAAWQHAVDVAPDRLSHWQGLFLQCYRWCSSYARSWRRPLLEIHDAMLERGDTTAVESAMSLALALGDSARLRRYADLLPEDAWYGRWAAAIGLGQERERAEVVERMPDLGSGPLLRIGNAAILTGLGLDDAEDAARQSRQGNPGSIYSLRQAVLARERGRHAEYRRYRDKLFQYFDVRTGVDAIAAAAVIAEWAIFGEPETDATLERADRMLSRVVAAGPGGSPDSLAVAHCFRSYLRIERGDTTGVAEAISVLRREPSLRNLALARMCGPFLELLLARNAGPDARLAATGRLNDAVRDRPVTFGRGPGLIYTDLNIAVAANLELARFLAELGHPETGLQAVERRPVQPEFWGLYGFHIDFVREEARLLAQAGETDAALSRYEKYFRLRPEPPDLASWAREWAAVRDEYEALLARSAG